MRALDYKRIGMIGAVVATSTLAWAVARLWLGDAARFSSITVMLWPALAFALSSAIAGLAFLLQEHAWDRVAGILASWAAFVFFWRPNIWYVSALPVFFLFWWMGAQHIRHDLTDRHAIRVSATLGQGMKLIILGSFLMVSLGFYLLPSKPTVTNISRAIQQQAQTISGNPLIGPSIDQIVRTWLNPVRQFIPPILAFGLFLALWSLNSLVRAPAVWLGDGLFHLLRRTGFVRVVEKSVKAEVITF